MTIKWRVVLLLFIYIILNTLLLANNNKGSYLLVLNDYDVRYYERYFDDDEKSIYDNNGKSSSETSSTDNNSSANGLVSLDSIHYNYLVQHPIQKENLNPKHLTLNNYLFIKTPKVGGTTLAIMLERYARLSNLKIAHPPDHMGEKSCGGSDSALPVWDGMVNNNVNGGKISIFLSQACFYTFMKNPKWWTPGKVITIGLVRNPWSRFVSAFRYTQERCMLHDEKLRNTYLCDANFEKYVRGKCHATYSCSQQFSWMSGVSGLQMGHLSLTRATHILNQYDFVFVIERFDECLVLMSMLFGIPFEVLPYLQANKDDLAPMPKYTKKTQYFATSRGLQADSQLYEIALRKIQVTIDSFNSEQRGYFNKTLSLLKEVNQIISVECNKPEANHEDDCLTNDPLVKKKLSCRHACVEGVAKRVIEEQWN